MVFCHSRYVRNRLVLESQRYFAFLGAMAIERKNEARAIAAEKERAELLEQKSRIEDASGKEELARIKGFEKANEKPLPIPSKSDTSKSKKTK